MVTGATPPARHRFDDLVEDFGVFDLEVTADAEVVIFADTDGTYHVEAGEVATGVASVPSSAHEPHSLPAPVTHRSGSPGALGHRVDERDEGGDPFGPVRSVAGEQPSG